MHSASPFIRSIANANFNAAGPKALKLFTVQPAFFERLRDELQLLTERYSPSRVQDYDHATRWTNRDHNLSLLGKSFHMLRIFPRSASSSGRFPTP